MENTKYTYTITIADDGASGLDINASFNPAIPDDITEDQVTPAIFFAMALGEYLQNMVKEYGEGSN